MSGRLSQPGGQSRGARHAEGGGWRGAIIQLRASSHERNARGTSNTNKGQEPTSASEKGWGVRSCNIGVDVSVLACNND